MNQTLDRPKQHWHWIWSLIVCAVGIISGLCSKHSSELPAVSVIRIAAFLVFACGAVMVLVGGSRGHLIVAVGTLVYLIGYLVSAIPDLVSSHEQPSHLVWMAGIDSVVAAGLLWFLIWNVNSWFQSKNEEGEQAGRGDGDKPSS